MFYTIFVIFNTFLRLGLNLNESDYSEILNIFLHKLVFWIFLLEILITLNTSYYSKGNYITSRFQIFKNYLKYDSFLDLLSIFPLFLSGTGILGEGLDLMFLIRIVKLPYLIKRLEEYLQLRGKKEGIFQLLKLIFYVLFLAHIVACLWHYMAWYEIKNGQEITWLSAKNLENSHWQKKYIYSLYFSIVTIVSVGYGDISAQNEFECIFNIFMIIYGCGVFCYTINDIGNIFKEMNHEEKEFK